MKPRSEVCFSSTNHGLSPRSPQPAKHIHPASTAESMTMTAVCDSVDSPALVSIGYGDCERFQQQANNNYMEGVSDSPVKDGSAAESSNLAFQQTIRKGQLFQAAGRLEEALQYYRQALMLKKSTLAVEPQETQLAFADVLFHIGSIHMCNPIEGRLQMLEAFQRCLEIRSLLRGRMHESVAVVLHKLSQAYILFDERETSVELLIEAISILSGIGADRDDLSTMWTDLGRVQASLGEEEDAKSSFEEAGRIQSTPRRPGKEQSKIDSLFTPDLSSP